MAAHEDRVALDLQARHLWQATKDTERAPALQAALERALDATNCGIGVPEAQAALDAALAEGGIPAPAVMPEAEPAPDVPAKAPVSEPETEA